MAFRQRAQESASKPPVGAARSEAVPLAGQPCGSLARVLARVFRSSKPEVLNLGPLCGETVVYLAGRGARVHVEEFDPPAPVPMRQPGEPPTALKPFRLDQPTGRANLVLAWEMTDFIPPDRLAEYGDELRRLMADGGSLFLFSHQRPDAQNEPLRRYRVLADDMVVREVAGGVTHRRWIHPTREVERALAGFSIQGVQLQRNQMREIVAVRAG